MNSLPLVALFLLVTSAVGVNSENPKVTITNGELEGTIETARNGRSFYRFLGIPYGKVDKRFENSKPSDPWEGIRDATKLGPQCLQVNFIGGTQSGVEDCLILNVYTPKINTDKLLPTMFFIHGGAFLCGSANDYDGSFFMSEDVVLVAINYRLGALGFLNADVPSASGNQGLRDQVLALKWVQQNIRQFGGDPDQVTIFGESAGGISVSHHTMSPMSKGLFHAAITQSGTVTCPQASKEEDHLEEAKKLANRLDCPNSDPEYMVKCLRQIKSEEIMRAATITLGSFYARDFYTVPLFGPTIETVESELGGGMFYSEDPLKVLLEGRFNKVPLLTGITSHEGIFISASSVLENKTLLELTNEEWGRIAPNTFQYHNRARDPCKMSAKIREFYFGNEEVSKKNGNKLIDLYSDSWFVQCTKQSAQLYARFVPVYIYNLTHWGEHTLDMFSITKNSKGLTAPTHGDDLIYQFPMAQFQIPPLTKGSADEDFSIKMVKLWTSFGQNRKPTAIWGKSLKIWSQLDTEAEGPLDWVQLDNDLTLLPEQEEFTKRMDFWDKLLLPIQLKKLGVRSSAGSGSGSGTCSSKPIDVLIGSCSK